MKTPDFAQEEKLIEDAKKRLAEFGDTAEQLMREHPWKVAGAAAALGVVLGLLLRRS